MVIFNELRISDDKEKLIVDCYVENLSFYSDMYISSIDLYYYKNADSTGNPVDCDKVLSVYENKNDDKTVRAVRKCIDIADADVLGLQQPNFDGGLFFVRVECDGDLAPEAYSLPCGMDDVVDIGIIVDWEKLYHGGMQYISRLTDGCADPCEGVPGLENFIILWHSFRIALSVPDYVLIGKLWSRILRLLGGGAGFSVATPGCGCNK